VWYIPKKNGTQRQVVAYDPWVLELQHALLKVLREEIEPSLASQLCGARTGYRIGDIATELATAITQTSVVCHLDVVNWFNSITVDHLVKVLAPIVVDEPKIIAELVCYHGRLTQGGPCSPLLANAVANITWAPLIIDYANQHRLILKIYLDDIIFICNGTLAEAQLHLMALKGIVTSQGFRVHKLNRKAAYRCQKVLGLVINRPYGPRTPRVLRRKVKSIIHQGQ
jgi:hypothetical protein